VLRSLFQTMRTRRVAEPAWWRRLIRRLSSLSRRLAMCRWP
jgi:hypothetical protein